MRGRVGVACDAGRGRRCAKWKEEPKMCEHTRIPLMA